MANQLKTTFQIARRLYSGHRGTSSRVARPSVRLATMAMTLGLAVMFVTICVVFGFKQEVTRKVVGFGSHIQVVNFDNNSSFETQPIHPDAHMVAQIRGIKGIRSLQPFATKPGIVKTDSAFHGIVFKGVSPDYDWDFFSHNLKEGRLPALSDTASSSEVLISDRLSKIMRIYTGDRFFCYFVQNQVLARRLSVVGIYNTDFSDYDDKFILGDLRQVQQLNQWEEGQYSGLEITITDFDRLDDVAAEVCDATANRFDELGNTYLTQTIKQVDAQIFKWLDLLDMDVWVIIILMLVVAGFSLISGLIIMILDGVQLIGTFKALGADNSMIRRIFVWQATFIVIRGMTWGNIAGLLLCAAQYFLHLIPLDATAYYVSYVPISFNWPLLILLNIGTLALTLLMLIGPSYMIARISPAKVIRYE